MTTPGNQFDPPSSNPRALAGERHRLILDEIRRRGAVRVSDLVLQLGVSDMTVRRDLDILDSEGRLIKVHGGATSIAPTSSDEPGFEAKSTRQQAEKQDIARAAAALIKPGTAIGITAGTTTWHLAGQLTTIPDLIVVTNSVPVADLLHRRHGANATVILTGGVRTPSDALVGPVAVAALRTLHLDQVFMGVHGMSERAGFSSPNMMEADTNRAFLDTAERLVVLADHSKWGITGLSTIAPLDAADVLVTTAGLDQGARGVLAERAGQVLVTGDSPRPAATDRLHTSRRDEIRSAG